MEKALAFGGWPGFVVLLAGNVIGTIAFVVHLARRRHDEAFFVFIAFLPFTFYFGRALGLNVYEIVGVGTQFDQRIGPSTLIPIILAGAMAAAGRLRRPRARASRVTATLLWTYCVALTVSQLATHDPLTAVLLSVGAAWQFLILFYLLISIITDESRLLTLINAFVVLSLFNILIRVVCKGESLFIVPTDFRAGVDQTFGADAGRVGSGALGPAASYAGYLVVLITLSLGAAAHTRKLSYFAWTAILAVELLGTYTRGPLMLLPLLASLACFRSLRPIVLESLPFLFYLVVVFVLAAAAFASVRGFSWNPMDVDGFTLRLEAYRQFFEQFDSPLFGTGILNRASFQLSPWLVATVESAFIEVLEAAGLLPFCLLMILAIFSVATGVRASVETSRNRGVAAKRLPLSPFFLVALIQWLLFANSTGTSVLAYFPYEAMVLFWTLCFAGCLRCEMRWREQRQAALATFRSGGRLANSSPAA